MAEKALDKIIGQPTTKTMNIMTEKMAKMVTCRKDNIMGKKTQVLGTRPSQRRL